MRLDLSQLPRLLWLASLAGPIPATGILAQTAQTPSASLKQADADYREGASALNRNDLKTAQSKFEAVVRLAPTAEQGHSALGAVLVREGQMEAGIRELQKALAIQPGDGSAQLNLALAYEQTGASAQALPLFAKLEATAAAQKHPLPPYVLAAHASSLAAAGKIAPAITKMKEAIARQPGDPELHDELGSLYAQAQHWADAEQQFSEAIRLKPEFALAHLHLGMVFQAEQKNDAVNQWVSQWVNQWTEAYRLAPDNPGIALAVGKLLAAADQDEAAVPILEQAHRLAPQSTEAAYQLALVLQRVNRIQDAIALLQTVVQAEPRNTDALINLGMALTQAHQARDGVPFLQRAITQAPESVTAHQNLAAAYIQLNQLEDAIAELKAALKLAPDSPQMHYDLGVAYKLQDDAAHAIPELEAAQKLNPSGYEAAYVLGLMYLQTARYEEAAAQLETSLKLHPENGEGWATLGSVYNKLDKLPEAASALREATRQLPEQPDPHLTLATVLIKQNQTSEAAAERKIGAELMRSHMNRQRAEVATNSGKSLLAGGKIEDAVVQFRYAIGFDPKFAEAHQELAIALEKQGKAVEAAAERQQAEALGKSPQ